MESQLSPLALLVVGAILGFLPIIFVSTTCFLKISIVLAIVRNALGLQQVPPTIVINVLSIILTAFVMSPVFEKVIDRIPDENSINLTSFADLVVLADAVKDPILDFVKKYASPAEKVFFLDSARKTWAGIDAPEEIADEDFRILIPAFMISEIRRGFEIGFLLYLPFVIIDMIIANILLSMGSVMIAPNLISLPIKMFLITVAHGWSLLTHGLIESYLV